MAGVSPNLKIGIGADTSKFDAAMKSTKGELRDLSKTGSDALGALGSAIGLNTGQISQFSSAAKALAGQLSVTGKTGSAAFQSMVPAIKSAAGAIAGLGLAGAAVAFKALTAEAEAFKNTVAGANIEMMTAAYIDTYKQALHDMNVSTGRSVAEWMANVKKLWGTLPARGVAVFGSLNQGGDINEINSTLTTLNDKASQSEQIAGKIYRFQRLISDRAVEISELDAQIAEYRRIASDKTTTTAQRADAIAKATDLIKQKYEGPNGLVTLNAGLADLMKQQNDITESSPAQIDAANQQRIKANSLVRSENDELRSLMRLQNGITSQVSAEAAARKAANDAAKARAADLKSIAEWGKNSQLAPIQGPSSVTSGLAAPGLAPIQLAVSNWDGFFKDVDDGFLKKFPNGLELGVTFTYADGLTDMTQAVNAALVSLAETTSSIIGQLVGDLATGGDAWGNFTNAAISAFGDMAIAIGKIAMETGVASLGIQAAITALGPAGAAAAIGAGAALIALGTAVKTGLSNIASGNYSGGGYVASSTTSSAASGDFETREVSVNVTGTLQADGDQLVAVITNTQDKNYYTT